MPFLKGGSEALTRTKKYLEAGKLIFKDRVKIFSIHHIPDHKISEGANKFVTWILPQLQYKNPNIQVIMYQKLTPSPFIQCYLDKGEEVLIDCSFRGYEEIHDHLIRVLGKDREELRKESLANQTIINPGSFGRRYPRQCMCEVYGQLPCSGQDGPSSAFILPK